MLEGTLALMILIGSPIVGGMAKSRGRSTVAWTLGCFLITPFIGVVLLYGLPDLTEECDRIARMHQREHQLRAAAAAISGAEFAASLGSLRQLRDTDILTADEYADRKLRLFGDLKNRTITDSAELFLSSLVPLVRDGTLTASDVDAIKQLVLQPRS